MVQYRETRIWGLLHLYEYIIYHFAFLNITQRNN